MSAGNPGQLDRSNIQSSNPSERVIRTFEYRRVPTKKTVNTIIMTPTTVVAGPRDGGLTKLEARPGGGGMAGIFE